MKGIVVKTILVLCLMFVGFPSYALQERHLIFVRQGGSTALVNQGKDQIKQTGEILLTHGFDNRSIVAVYVAPDKGSQQCAKLLAAAGLFSESKIHREPRLADKKKAGSILAFYDEIESKHKEGHVIFIDDNTRSLQLIETLTQEKPELRANQPYIVPFSLRQASLG